MWAVEHWGVKPDILLTAKGIASGMPLGAMIARADLLEAWGPGAHGSTYGGNPVACAAALATIDLLEGGLIANAADARRPGPGRARARSVERFPALVRDVRGMGLMLGVEFDTAEHAEEVQWACFERGLLVLECGKSSVRMSPALTVSADEMDTAAADLLARRSRRSPVTGATCCSRSSRPAPCTRSRRPVDPAQRRLGRAMTASKVATMRDAIADARARRRHRRHRGLHAPHLLRGRPRDRSASGGAT